jgi:formiminotetrahydrofolate cyclodeaminase
LNSDEVLEKVLDSRNTDVGGGAACPLTAAMGASLMAMVCRLSAKKNYGLPPEAYARYADQLDALSRELREGMVSDAEGFGAFKEALALPKATEAEQAARKEAMAQAAILAAQAPAKNARLCRQVYEIALTLDGKVKKNAQSDVTIGKDMARLGVEGCLLNVKANLPLIQDPDAKAELEEDLEVLAID